MKPSYGVIVGRFQVNDLHDGHMELFRQVRARHNAIIVFVGVYPGGLCQKNPLDFATRRAMIQAKFPEFTVLPLDDCRTDEEWSRTLDSAIGSQIGPGTAILYGGRDSFVPHYKGRFTPVHLALPVGTQEVSGTDIRDEFSNKVIESAEFRAGMIYAVYHKWPECLPCVDVAIFNDDETELLLAQKRSEYGGEFWRFIGGHYERRKHTSWEHAAACEVLEETGLSLVTLTQVCGGQKIEDWRYTSPDHGITTTFFRGRAMGTHAKAADDIAAVKWFKVTGLTEQIFIPEHRILFNRLQSKGTHAAEHSVQSASGD